MRLSWCTKDAARGEDTILELPTEVVAINAITARFITKMHYCVYYFKDICNLTKITSILCVVVTTVTLSALVAQLQLQHRILGDDKWCWGIEGAEITEKLN